MYFMVSAGILTLVAGESAAQNRYFPLAVGNRWLYKFERPGPAHGRSGGGVSRAVAVFAVSNQRWTSLIQTI